MSKGSRRRPGDDAAYAAGYERIFGAAKPPCDHENSYPSGYFYTPGWYGYYSNCRECRNIRRVVIPSCDSEPDAPGG